MRIVRIIVVGTLFLAFGLIAYYYNKPSTEFERLIRGDNTVEIRSMTVAGQGRTIFVNDPSALSFLTRSLRGVSKSFEHSHGLTYLAHFDLGTYFTVTASINVPNDEGGGMNLYFPYNDDACYWVPLAEPIPVALSSAFAKMKSDFLNSRR